MAITSTASSGVDRAFEELFAVHYWAIRDFVLRRAPAAAVEDVVAETFLVAWRRFGEIGDDPRPWLLGVARRVLANQLRADRRRAALAIRLEGVSSPASGAWEPPAQMDSELASALARLSAHDREVLLLVAWDGLDSPCAAKVLGCSPTAFRVRLHRARRRIAKDLAGSRIPAARTQLTEEIS
jgi:RNA polymerase sigma-70 factor (ECF subfamily)